MATSEVVSAALGGCISTAVLYPLEVLKTRMQSEPHRSSVVQTSKDSSLSSNNKEDTNHQDENEEGESIDESTTTTTTTASSSKASTTTTTSMWSYARQLYQREGIRVFFDGMEASAFQSACEKALYFWAYTTLQSAYRRRHHHHVRSKNSSSSSLTSSSVIGTGTKLFLGYCAEWAHLPLTLPLDCWTTKIQTNTDPSQGPMKLLLTMLSEKGSAGMYKGIQAYWVLCFKPALQYTIFEQCKAMILASRRPTPRQENNSNSSSSSNHSSSDSLGPAESFLLGMVARTIATLIIYPYLRAKVLLQTQKRQSLTEAEQLQEPLSENDEEEVEEVNVANESSLPSNASTSTAGATATTISTTSTTLLKLASLLLKKMTALNSNSSTNTNNTIPTMLMTMVQTDGLASLYQGVGPELTRGALSAALMLMIKEQLGQMVQHVLQYTKQK